MSVTKSGYINGSDMLLTVDSKAIGHCTSHSVTITSDTKDRAVKPAASTAYAGANLWKDKTVTGLNVSITGEGLAFYAETEGGYKEALALIAAGSAVAVTCIERDGSAAYLSGNFIVTSLERTDPANDDSTYTIQLENSGAVTFTGSNLT